MERDDDIPCGRCGCGVYDFDAACGKAAKALFETETLPPCKTFERKCVGAKHLLEHFLRRDFPSWNEHVKDAMK